MNYCEFIEFIDRLKIKEIDAFEIVYVNENDVEKILKFDDVI